MKIFALGKEIDKIATDDWTPVTNHSPSDIGMTTVDYYFSVSTQTFNARVYIPDTGYRDDYFQAVIVDHKMNPCHIID